MLQRSTSRVRTGFWSGLKAELNWFRQHPNSFVAPLILLRYRERRFRHSALHKTVESHEGRRVALAAAHPVASRLAARSFDDAAPICTSAGIAFVRAHPDHNARFPAQRRCEALWPVEAVTQNDPDVSTSSTVLQTSKPPAICARACRNSDTITLKIFIGY